MKKELYNKAAKLLSIAILISALLFWAFEERFDENIWSSEPSTRYKMVDDIIESGLLMGKTKEDVILLLGNPEIDNPEILDVMIYKIGKPPSFFEAKDEKLAVVFQNGSVISVGIASE